MKVEKMIITANSKADFFNCVHGFYHKGGAFTPIAHDTMGKAKEHAREVAQARPGTVVHIMETVAAYVVEGPVKKCKLVDSNDAIL